MLICPFQLCFGFSWYYIGIDLLPSFFSIKLSVCFCFRYIFCQWDIGTLLLFNQFNNTCLSTSWCRLYTFILMINSSDHFSTILLSDFYLSHTFWASLTPLFFFFLNIKLFVCVLIPDSRPSFLLQGRLLYFTEGVALLYPGFVQRSPIWPLPWIRPKLCLLSPQVVCGLGVRLSGNRQWHTG